MSCTSYEYRLFPNARGTGIHTDGAIFLHPTIRLSDVPCVYEFKLERVQHPVEIHVNTPITGEICSKLGGLIHPC